MAIDMAVCRCSRIPPALMLDYVTACGVFESDFSGWRTMLHIDQSSGVIPNRHLGDTVPFVSYMLMYEC